MACNVVSRQHSVERPEVNFVVLRQYYRSEHCVKTTNLPSRLSVLPEAAVGSTWKGRPSSHQRLRASAGRGKRHQAAAAKRIEIIAVIPVGMFCHFCSGWPPFPARRG